MGCGSSGIKESTVEESKQGKSTAESSKKQLNLENKANLGGNQDKKVNASQTNEISVTEYTPVQVINLPELESDPNVSELNPIKITLEEVEKMDENLQTPNKRAIEQSSLSKKNKLLRETLEKSILFKETHVLKVSKERILVDSVNKTSTTSIKNDLKVSLIDEKGLDTGESTREWFALCTEEMTKPESNLLIQPDKEKIEYLVNPFLKIQPENLQYFAFIGQFMGRALLEKVSIPLNLNLFVYKQIFSKEIVADDFQFINLESYESFYRLKPGEIEHLGINYETMLPYKDTIEFVELFPGGSKAEVTCAKGFCWAYINYFLTKNSVFIAKLSQELFKIIPEKHFKAFSEEELKFLFEGEPEIDIEDWKDNTEYFNLKGEPEEKYKTDSKTIKFFWETVGELNKREKSIFLHFWTGTKTLPLGGVK